MTSSPLAQLVGIFVVLSLLSVGGGNGVLPDMQRAAVDQHHWLTARQFLDLFAISRATPGPGALIVVLIGLKAAGFVGAVVAGLSMFVPSCLIVHLAARFWSRAARSAWRETAERALAPVAVGLTLGSGIALVRGTEHGWPAYGVTAGSTLLLTLTELHPMIALSAGAAVLLVIGS
jgi:chromate transporter